jgi:Ca2+-binding EF-hand superfamily protein
MEGVMQEVAELIQEMGIVPNREEIDKLISECDADNSGTIEAGEFLALMARYFCPHPA